MTNPSSRLTKFRLTISEYDFEVRYIKGKDNVSADALSRITIDDLKNINNLIEEKLYVLTRAQSKQNSELKLTSTSKLCNATRIDHPGVVEVIKKPKNTCELKIVNNDDFIKILKKGKDSCQQEFVNYVKQCERIYINNEASRSALTLGASLRQLEQIINQFKIPELIIKKNDINNLMIKKILEDPQILKRLKVKLTIIKDVQTIDNTDSRELILNDFHNLKTGGHAGVNRMFNNIKKYYYWPGLHNDVQDFVKHCDHCQRYKFTKPNFQPLTITSTASSAFEKVSLDIVGPLEEDEQNNKYILTLQCDLSKFVEAYPLANKEAGTVARTFVEQFILRYGVPSEILTDQGTEFMSSTLKEICKLLNIRKLNSTAYHHQTLGALENTHKSLGAYLRIQTSKYPDSWSSWLPYWCFSFNTTVHSTTKYMPYELVFGKIVRLPSNLTKEVDPLYNFSNYPLELKYRLQQASSDATDNSIAAKVLRKQMYDRNCKSINFKNGEKVMVKCETRLKMDPVYKGPYQVIRDSAPNVLIDVDNKEVLVHKDRVKKYNARDK